MDEESQISIHAICRTCLANLQHAAAYDLFLIPGLATKLCSCTSLQVEKQDGFPKNLCFVCYTKLNDLHAFQRQCVDSVQKFKDMVANNCLANEIDHIDVLHASMQDNDNEDEHINFDPLLHTKLEIVDIKEEIDKFGEDKESEAEEVNEESSSSSESDFDNDNVDDDADFQVNSSESDDARPLSNLRSTPKATEAKTKEKSKETDNEEESSSSESDNEEEEFEEPKPRARPKPRTGVDRRLLRPIECHICHQKFVKHNRYEEHMKHHNDLLPFQCEVETCKKGFTTAAGLQHHVDHTHLELVKLHTCTVEGCDKAFPRSRSLTNHLRRTHNIITPKIRDHPCTKCEKVFRCSTALKKHMFKHTGEEPPISCNICSKRFHINSELRDHLLRHAGVKNHVCPYCGIGKTTRQEWNKHILTHTREKQFKCTQCDHASHNKQSLANHIKVVHMKIKEFACQYCGKTFGKSYACKVHERYHTGEDCCECKICGKVFLFEQRLTKHLKTHEKRDKKKAAKRSLDGEDPEESQNEAQSSTEPVDVKPIPVVPPKPRNSNRVERVDISQLAGTSVNPIPSVSVPSWSPQVNFTKKEGQHICPGCGRGFNHIGNMKLHYKNIHERVKDFACRYCPKRFSTAQILRHHEWTHTGEKPLECDICGHRFRQKHLLNNHIRKIHENPRKPQRTKKSKNPKTPKAAETRTRKNLTLNTKPPKILEEYQDPAAERAAASAALLAQQIEESRAKQKAQDKTREIQEAAYEQLTVLDKLRGSYDTFHERKVEAESARPEPQGGV